MRDITFSISTEHCIILCIREKGKGRLPCLVIKKYGRNVSLPSPLKDLGFGKADESETH